MPLLPNLKKVLIIGSGPIVIGQAAEFDYAGTQACRVLRELGVSTVLVNSNPATIMTDAGVADRVYIEPLSEGVLKRIIRKERPDALISTIGGQNGLTLSMQLAKSGFLKENGVQLLGASLETIENAEDRLLFKELMKRIGEPTIPSEIATEVTECLRIAEEIGYPVIVRPAFTLGGSGGGIAADASALAEIAQGGISASPIGQVLIEKCVSGYKEIEFEVMRDGADNAIAVCSMENFDPVGVHTGDSIVVAPAVTLANPEYQMLRSSALRIIRSLGVCGGCNVQFALHPESMDYAVIEVNPRVSRSSALASKATGYPIAKVSTAVAVGLRLDEIQNAVTRETSAFFEPSIDYIVVKFPKWPFDKFAGANRRLGTQMKATGEVMSIGATFEQALMKAVRGAEIKHDTLYDAHFAAADDETLLAALDPATDERLFAVYEAVRRGMPLQKIHDVTRIDLWFLGKLEKLAAMERRLTTEPMTDALYVAAKRKGYPDKAIARLSGQKLPPHLPASYRMVDTCAAEFTAHTPYFYGVAGGDNEAADFLRARGGDKKTVLVLGSGPIRIGQGIEFDYASVHCVRTLKELGYDVVMVNNNPETVSTDFDTADRLYFEPMTLEDVLDVVATEHPVAAVAMFGGQTAINLARGLTEHGVPILGTGADAIDMAEDREQFDAILSRLGIARPAGRIVASKAEAMEAAGALGYPVLVRPSYVLGGKNMIIAYSDRDLESYMDFILTANDGRAVLVDKYLSGQEVEVDAISDGTDVLIPGIMEHIERAGVHSGDSIAIYPAWNLAGATIERLTECTKNLAVALGVRGLINIQYVVHNNRLYVIEANPRASRTIPYISKVTGLPIIDLACRAALGEKLADLGYGSGLWRRPALYAAKVPAFSFEKLSGVDSHLGPEMKSTGEVLGIGRTLPEALYKGLAAAGFRVESHGGVLVTMSAREAFETTALVRRMKRLGFTIYAPRDTGRMLSEAGVVSIPVVGESERAAIFKVLESGRVQYVLAPSEQGALPDEETVLLRRKAVECRIACFSSIDTAGALMSALESGYGPDSVELFEIGSLPKRRNKLNFIKMRSGDNDFIFFDCFEQKVESPESLCVRLSNRRRGIGGDGIVLIEPSGVADASMRMFNADGSPAAIAGNAMRCVAKYLFESGRVQKTALTIETGSGVRAVRLFVRDDEACAATIEMPAPDFAAASVPVRLEKKARVVDEPYRIGGQTYRITCLSMGNPHCVIFVPDADAVDLASIGPLLERAPIFPERANISFAHVIDRANIQLRVFERGIGETQSCGTGACAAAAAAVELGLCDMDSDVLVHLRGGDLVVNRRADGLTLSGDAQTDFTGTVEV